MCLVVFMLLLNIVLVRKMLTVSFYIVITKYMYINGILSKRCKLLFGWHNAQCRAETAIVIGTMITILTIPPINRYKAIGICWTNRGRVPFSSLRFVPESVGFASCSEC